MTVVVVGKGLSMFRGRTKVTMGRKRRSVVTETAMSVIQLQSRLPPVARAGPAILADKRREVNLEKKAMEENKMRKSMTVNEAHQKSPGYRIFRRRERQFRERAWLRAVEDPGAESFSGAAH